MFTTLSASHRATLFLIVSACCFGSVTTLTVLTNRAGLPFITAMSWRYVLGGFILFLLMKSTSSIDVTWQKKWRLVLIGATAQALITYLSLYALNYIPVAPLAFLFFTYPAWVALLSALRGKERVTSASMTALTLAMLGISVMIGAPSAVSLNSAGVMLGLGTALLYALYLPAMETAQRGLPPSVSTFYLILGAGATFLVSSVITGQMQLPPSLEAWGYVGLLSVVCTVLAFTALIAGLRELGPLRTAIISTVEPFFTSLLGVFFLRENLTVTTLTGGALIAVAVVLLHWQGRKVSDRAERFTV
ncbi:MAG: DMT family transporter [Gemmatimonadaceae bacterium]|nr:DMT family transporter [Gemmatimonadaceae bacterium]